MTAARGDALGAVYSEALGLAARQDRLLPGSGEATRARVAAAIRRELAAIRAEAAAANTTTTTTTTTTGRNTTRPPPPYASRRARPRA